MKEESWRTGSVDKQIFPPFKANIPAFSTSDRKKNNRVRGKNSYNKSVKFFTGELRYLDGEILRHPSLRWASPRTSFPFCLHLPLFGMFPERNYIQSFAKQQLPRIPLFTSSLPGFLFFRRLFLSHYWYVGPPLCSVYLKVTFPRTVERYYGGGSFLGALTLLFRRYENPCLCHVAIRRFYWALFFFVVSCFLPMGRGFFFYLD